VDETATQLITIISGGQTGADRAALDFARSAGFAHGGWCPRGRRAEDGPIPDCYLLQETPSPDYPQRTRWNVRDSDATVVLSISANLRGGSALTLALAGRLQKPFLHLAQGDFESIAAAAKRLNRFLEEHAVRRLNIAGSRASQEPAVGEFVSAVLTIALQGDGAAPAANSP
jgi:hypothetical protein